MNLEHDQEEYLINELAQKASVTVRTIRYYTDQGLLPPPDTRGKYATYNGGHLLRLELIRQMKEAYLPLREIREIIQTLSDEEVQKRLGEGQPNIQASRPPRIAEAKSSALDYIAQVRGRQAELRAPEKDGTDILPDRPLAPKPPSQSPGVPMGKIVILEDDLPGETWRHIEIAPGIELHLREPVEPDLLAVLESMIKDIQIAVKKRRGGIK
jgi:DNA-binding transcriptional MerR regulator